MSKRGPPPSPPAPAEQHLQPAGQTTPEKRKIGEDRVGLLRDLPQSLLNYSRAPKGCEAAIVAQSFPGGWYWASDMQMEWEKRGSWRAKIPGNLSGQ